MEALEAIAVAFLLGLVKMIATGTLTPPPSTAVEAQDDPALDKRLLDNIRAQRAAGEIP